MEQNPTELEAQVIRALATLTYEQVRELTGLSRGKIYSIAMRYGARKNEAKIREKAAERKQRQKDTLAEIIDQIATADVLDYFDGIPDGDSKGGVSLIATSPPYNVGKAYGNGASGDQMRHLYYLGWLMQIVSESARVLKEGGVLALQVGSTRTDRDEIVPIDLLVHDFVMKSGLTFQNRIVWTIPHGLTPSRRLSGRHETIMIYSKGAPAHFNADAARTPQKQPGKRAYKGPNKGSLSGHPFGAWPSDVWSVANVGHNSPEKTGHPAQMPIEIARRLINLYTMPGDLIIDPFAGSGTTAAAAIETGRCFSGCDLFYEDMRAERLRNAGLADICELPGVSSESVAVWQAEAVRVDYNPQQQSLDLKAA